MHENKHIHVVENKLETISSTNLGVRTNLTILIRVVRPYAVVKRLGARGTNSGDLMKHQDAWPHRNVLLKVAMPS